MSFSLLYYGKSFNFRLFFFNTLSNNLKKGLTFGILGNILVGLQPIIANSAKSIDSHVFAAMTCLVEATIFFPLIFLEFKRKKLINGEKENLSLKNSILKNWKKNIWLLIFIGIIFSINQLLFFIGYRLAGAINGSLTQKTSVFFGLIYGFLLLKEKISKIQILFSVVLFAGLVIAITQGNLESLITHGNLEVLIGVLIILLITCLWMFGHTMTKPMFSRKDLTPTQMVFTRNILSGVILIITYFVFPPIDVSQFFNPYNQFYFITMGVVYGLGLFCWYKTLSYLDVSNATIVLSPTPIVTAVFATFFLGEIFTLFHFIGTLIVIISIIVIVNQQKEKRA